jgi:hypothetical protein
MQVARLPSHKIKCEGYNTAPNLWYTFIVKRSIYYTMAETPSNKREYPLKRDTLASVR